MQRYYKSCNLSIGNLAVIQNVTFVSYKNLKNHSLFLLVTPHN